LSAYRKRKQEKIPGTVVDDDGRTRCGVHGRQRRNRGEGGEGSTREIQERV